jgi:hypothetical protein
VLKARSYGHIKGAKNEAHRVDQEQFFRGFGAHRWSIAERFATNRGGRNRKEAKEESSLRPKLTDYDAR